MVRASYGLIDVSFSVLNSTCSNYGSAKVLRCPINVTQEKPFAQTICNIC